MLAFENVTKVFRTRRGENRVLDGVSFTIRRGQSIGILGQNGAGKTTLTRLMTGILLPTSGKIRRDMSVSWPLGFSGGFHGSLTGADNVRFIARVYGIPVQPALDFVSDFAELGDYFDMPVRTYSTGMRARLAFGISLAVDFDCYVVDEITAVGDRRFTQRCRAALARRRQTGALIMVSHHTNVLQKFCDSGAVLRQGRLTFYNSIRDAVAAYDAL